MSDFYNAFQYFASDAPPGAEQQLWDAFQTAPSATLNQCIAYISNEFWTSWSDLVCRIIPIRLNDLSVVSRAHLINVMHACGLRRAVEHVATTMLFCSTNGDNLTLLKTLIDKGDRKLDLIHLMKKLPRLYVDRIVVHCANAVDTVGSQWDFPCLN